MIDAEFLRVFERDKPEIVEWAFREHRRTSNFFPTVAEIATLCGIKKRELREAAEAETRKREKAELEQARAEGKLLDFADVRQELVKIVNSKQMEPVPVPPAEKPFTNLNFTDERRAELKRQAEQVRK